MMKRATFAFKRSTFTWVTWYFSKLMALLSTVRTQRPDAIERKEKPPTKFPRIALLIVVMKRTLKTGDFDVAQSPAQCCVN